MAPQRDPDVDLGRDGPVVVEDGLVVFPEEGQHRSMHHNVVGADPLGVLRQLDHHVDVLVRARHHGAGAPLAGRDRDLQATLAFLDRHREELALLAGDEQAVDAEFLRPMRDVATEADLVDRQIGLERHQGGGPDSRQVLARV